MFRHFSTDLLGCVSHGGKFLCPALKSLSEAVLISSQIRFHGDVMFLQSIDQSCRKTSTHFLCFRDNNNSEKSAEMYQCPNAFEFAAQRLQSAILPKVSYFFGSTIKWQRTAQWRWLCCSKKIQIFFAILCRLRAHAMRTKL